MAIPVQSRLKGTAPLKRIRQGDRVELNGSPFMVISVSRKGKTVTLELEDDHSQRTSVGGVARARFPVRRP